MTVPLRTIAAPEQEIPPKPMDPTRKTEPPKIVCDSCGRKYRLSIVVIFDGRAEKWCARCVVGAVVL